MVEDLKEYLKSIKFDKQLKKLTNTIKNKKVVIYGTGKLYNLAKELYDFSKLNIIAETDKLAYAYSFLRQLNGVAVCNPKDIVKFNPDYVLIATRYYESMIKDVKNKYLKNTKIKIKPLFKNSNMKFDNIFQKIMALRNAKYDKLIKLNEEIFLHLKQLEIKNSMTDQIYTNNQNVRFYLPNYPFDLIQRAIVNDDFFEINTLLELDKYINKGATILDIGANIGNHSLYWAANGAKKIYAFEPVINTFSILKRNVELNNLTSVIEINNFGLSDVISNAQATNYPFENIGGINVRPNNDGDLKIMPLDNLKFQDDKIDFMKIDVEGHEINVLKGAIETIKKYKPMIFVESFYPNNKVIYEMLTPIGYKLERCFSTEYNYLYIPQK